MKEYIEKCLRKNVTIRENKTILEKLPLRFAGNYCLYTVSMKEGDWLLIHCHPSDYMMAFSADYSDAMLPPDNVMVTFSNAVPSY